MLVLHPKRRAKAGRLLHFGLLSRITSSIARVFSMPAASSRRRLIRYAILGIMLFTLLGGDRGLIQLVVVLSDRSALRTDLDHLKTRKIFLDSELKKHTTDRKEIERIAREQLDMVKKGESVYKFPSR